MFYPENAKCSLAKVLDFTNICQPKIGKPLLEKFSVQTGIAKIALTPPPTVYHKGGLGYSSPILGSAQNFLFNLQTEFHTIWMSKSHNIFEYLVKAYKSGIGYACIKEERKFNGTRPPSTPHTNGPLFEKSGQMGLVTISSCKGRGFKTFHL